MVVGKVLDVGIGILRNIKGDTSVLPEINNGIGNINNGIENLNAKFDSFITEQRGHNKRLEKILEKLAEK